MCHIDFLQCYHSKLNEWQKVTPRIAQMLPKGLFPWRRMPTVSVSPRCNPGSSAPWLGASERAATPTPVSDEGLLLLQVYNGKQRKLEKKMSAMSSKTTREGKTGLQLMLSEMVELLVLCLNTNASWWLSGNILRQYPTLRGSQAGPWRSISLKIPYKCPAASARNHTAFRVVLI